MTDVNMSTRRLWSCTTTVPELSLSNRARAASIFLFVVGDFCPHIRRAPR